MNMDALIFEPFVTQFVVCTLMIVRVDFAIDFNAEFRPDTIEVENV